MKKVYTILSTLLLTTIIWAQSPEKMSYQAVIRDCKREPCCKFNNWNEN